MFDRLTQEQNALLTYLEEQRVAAIQGAAGTGKTLAGNFLGFPDVATIQGGDVLLSGSKCNKQTFAIDFWEKMRYNIIGVSIG